MPDAMSEPPTAEPPVAPPLPDLTGRTFGDYQILRRLGTGGMGQVYLARQLSLKREVALKFLRTDLATSSTALQRFEAEAHAVAKLNHPNIVHIHQIGEYETQRYMVLEYVEGRNLRDHLARKGPPDLPVTLSIIRQVALALQNAHDQGIVHRDIKPENILVTRKVDVKVTDFGLSRFFAGSAPALNLTQSGVTLGTPLYMSPEQVQGKPVDQRSDIYSFGVTCYHMLAGEPPFRGSTAFDVALKHVQEQPRPLPELCPDLPADLCVMVHKMMAKGPDERYQSTRDILRDLVKVREGIAIGLPQVNDVAFGTQPVASGPMTQGEVFPVAGPARRGRWGLAAFVGGVAIVGGVILHAATNRAPEPAPTTPSPASGLPDIRPPEKLVTTRERELLALLASPDTKPEDVVGGSIELGLLYVKERRLDDARDRFEKLEQEQLATGGPQPPVRTASMIGRLGQAVVLAHRDTPNAAQQSNDLFLKVVNEPFPKSSGKFDKGERGYPVVATALLRYPDLAQEVSDALNRNAAALGKTTLTPNALEQLRFPPKVGKKE